MNHLPYIISICFLLCLCFVLIRKLYKFSIILLELESSIEESLDILDERYKKMNDILKKPVFFDSIEIRQVINEIKICHDSVLLIANKLTRNVGLDGEKKDKKIIE